MKNKTEKLNTLKTFLKNNWFKLGIISILIFSLLLVFYLYTKKQKELLESKNEFRSCVENAQRKRQELNDDTTKAWIENGMTLDWVDRSRKEIEGVYDDQIKDCLLLKR